MAQTRVLVVEDSATVRERLCSVLAADPEIDLVCTARDGRQAIDFCRTHRPDVITMDMMLPVMNGLAATQYIMAHCPTPILVVSSSFNRGEIFRTYDALAAGAVDVLEKPSGHEPDGDWEQRFLSALKIVSRTGNLEIVTASVNALSAAPAFARPDGGLYDGLIKRLTMIARPLRDAVEAAERVREIVSDLRIFSRSETEGQTRPVDVHHVLDTSIRMASNEIRHRANLFREFGDIAMVEGTETRLGQVFLNLIVNAAQAIPSGHAGANEIKISTQPDGPDRVAVVISDTGVGIAPDKLERVFDPFFTTKAVGAGTGLGLAICHRLIAELGGNISVKSEIGKGTEFRVVLPRAKTETFVAATILPSEIAALTALHGRVLVVDDEPMLRRTIDHILSSEHDVVAVASARQALDMIVAGDKFDAILSDLMMPEMTGMDLYAALAQSQPDEAAKMIFMTGGAFTPEAAAFLQEEAHLSINKPFRPAALRELLQKALQQHSTLQ